MVHRRHHHAERQGVSDAPRIYLSAPHMCGRELDFVREAFRSNWIAPLGPDVDAFERELCRYTGARHAVALVSGTAAIHLALILLDVTRGDEVICSTFTFAGGAFPIAYQGATPVFVDSEPRSWNIDPELLETAIKDRIRQGKQPKAVVVVHLYGQPADMDPIVDICARHEVALIEDAAESLGASYQGRHTGTKGRFGVLSFNGNKIITTSGGGMLLGQSAEDIARARSLATQARELAPHYEHEHMATTTGSATSPRPSAVASLRRSTSGWHDGGRSSSTTSSAWARCRASPSCPSRRTAGAIAG
jgi:dTDP-4-amino-4,6-dideoxygalactose transaminase